jgi:hypothetical protein
MVSATCRKFLTNGIVPQMAAWREAAIVYRDVFRKAGEPQVTADNPGMQLRVGHTCMDEYPISRQYTDASFNV